MSREDRQCDERRFRMWNAINLGRSADREFMSLCLDLDLDYEESIKAPLEAIGRALESKSKRK